MPSRARRLPVHASSWRHSGKSPCTRKRMPKGQFVFQSLEETNYYLAAQAPGYLDVINKRADFSARLRSQGADPNTCEIQPGSGDISKTTDASGTVHGKIAVALTKGAVIGGRVTDPDGLPMENARIQILRKGPVVQNGLANIHGGQTNDKGEFRAGQLEAGTYYVRVDQSGGGAWESSYRSTYYPRAIDLAGAKPLEIAAGQQARADIQIARVAGVRVSGRLIAPDIDASGSRRFTYASVALVPEDSRENTNQPFTNGRENYSFEDVLPGHYTLLAVIFETGVDPFGGNQKAVFGMKRSIEIGDQEMDGVDLTLQPLADLPGTVTFQEGCPAIPVRVSMYPRGGFALGPAPMTTTAPDGSFVLQGVGPGHRMVNVSGQSQGVYATSVKLGDRDVLKEGIDWPVSGAEPLRIEVGCNTGRLR